MRSGRMQHVFLEQDISKTRHRMGMTWTQASTIACAFWGLCLLHIAQDSIGSQCMSGCSVAVSCFATDIFH